VNTRYKCDFSCMLSCYNYLRQGGYIFVVVCISLCLFANEQLIKFWWRSGSPSEYVDYFPGWEIRKVVLTDMRRATLHCRACTIRHHQ